MHQYILFNIIYIMRSKEDQTVLSREVIRFWPGQPMTAHWGISDPVRDHVDAEQEYRGFYRAYLELEARIRIFTSLPISGLNRLALQKRLDEIGKLQAEENTGKTVNQ